jgi:Trm5-related predicted tRNA methylase
MKNIVSTKNQEQQEQDDMLAEYNFDYQKARPNRFVTTSDNERTVVLDPDIARVFTSSEAVNNALRALLSALPDTLKTHAG